MRVLALVALLAVVAQSATIYDALRASNQFTGIKALVDKVPQLKAILSDPNTKVTFFAPSDKALENVPFIKPFRYLFPGVLEVSKMSAGSHYNFRGEKIAFDVDNGFLGMRTEYVFVPGTSSLYQPRILRAPLRKENMLENGNLYYIDRQVYSCVELTYAACVAIADDQCRDKCSEQFTTVSGTNVINNYPDLMFQFKPPNPLPPVRPTAAGAPAAGAPGGPPASGPPGSAAADASSVVDKRKTDGLLNSYPYDAVAGDPLAAVDKIDYYIADNSYGYGTSEYYTGR